MRDYTTVETLSLGSPTHDTGSDYMLAQMLQLEYDREHDRQLQVEEKHFNKQSKGSAGVAMVMKSLLSIA